MFARLVAEPFWSLLDEAEAGEALSSLGEASWIESDMLGSVWEGVCVWLLAESEGSSGEPWWAGPGAMARVI